MLKVNRFFENLFTNRNTVIMTITLTIIHFFNNLYVPWWPLYLRELGASIGTIGLLFTLMSFLKSSSARVNGFLGEI